MGFIAVAALISGPVFAHGGGLNSEGCHHSRKTGDYHCHRGSSSSRVPSQTSSSNGTFRYRNCSEARVNGAAPVRLGDTGYGPHLDRDADAVGRE
jgi:hypothetical protein